MSQRPSQKSRPVDPECLELLLDVELACTFVLQSATPSFPRGARRGGAPSHEAVTVILQRIAAALAQLSITCEGARVLLDRAEWGAVSALAGQDALVADQAAAKRILLAAVPRLFFGTQALISEGRESWQREGRKAHGSSRPAAAPVASPRSRVA